MGNRIIFTIKHDKKVLAYIYQNWGAGDGETIAEEVRKAASKYGLNISERAGAITAARIAGEAVYGHALWNGSELHDDDEWKEATKYDREYLENHRDEIVADNQDKDGITFFYGTSQEYPEYIDSWCEDSFTMEV